MPVPFPNRYIHRINGALEDAIPATTSAGPASSGQLVALGASGYLDPSLFPSSLAAGVTSLNSLTGAITLAGGSGVTISASGNVLTLNASASGGSTFLSGDVVVSGGRSVVAGFYGTPLQLSGALVDGVCWQYIAASGAWVPVFDRATRPVSSIKGKPGAGQLVMIYTAEAQQTYPANFEGSVGSCGVLPAATATYSIYKGLTLVGTATVDTAGNFTFDTGGLPVTLNKKDRLTMTAPSSQDTFLADVGITLVGTRGPVAPISIDSYPILTWKGAYSNSTAYNLYDLVSYNGGSYICIQASLGNLPTNITYWNLVAQPGANGTTTSVNGLTGNIIISGGQNVGVQTIGQTVVVSASGGINYAPGTVLLGSWTASSSSEIDITTRNAPGQSGVAFQSDFDEYELHIVGFKVGTAGAAPLIQFSQDGGVTWDTASHYDWGQMNTLLTSTGVGSNAQGAVNAIVIFADSSRGGLGNSESPGMVAKMTIYDPLSTTDFKLVKGEGIAKYNGNGQRYQFQFGGTYWQTPAVTAMRVLLTSGVIAAGRFRLYGVQH